MLNSDKLLGSFMNGLLDFDGKEIEIDFNR